MVLRWDEAEAKKSKVRGEEDVVGRGGHSLAVSIAQTRSDTHSMLAAESERMESLGVWCPMSLMQLQMSNQLLCQAFGVGGTASVRLRKASIPPGRSVRR